MLGRNGITPEQHRHVSAGGTVNHSDSRVQVGHDRFPLLGVVGQPEWRARPLTRRVELGSAHVPHPGVPPMSRGCRASLDEFHAAGLGGVSSIDDHVPDSLVSLGLNHGLDPTDPSDLTKDLGDVAIHVLVVRQHDLAD
jgi:hypothetical protein